MKICGPKGRDCIERNSTSSFNCSTTCEGIYADVQWVEKKMEEVAKNEAEEAFESKLKGEVGEELSKFYRRFADLEKEMNVMKRDGLEKGEELEKEKYKMMIAEYRKFKTKNVKHFMFNSGKNSSAFGKVFIAKFCHSIFQGQIALYSLQEV